MKLLNTMIVWTPNSAEITVIQHPDKNNVTRKFQCSHGACWCWWGDLSHDKRLATFFAICHHIIINDKVEAQAVRKAMLVVDDVREFVPTDF